MRPLSPESLRDDVPDGRCRSAFLPEADAQLGALQLAQGPEQPAHLLPVSVLVLPSTLSVTVMRREFPTIVRVTVPPSMRSRRHSVRRRETSALRSSSIFFKFIVRYYTYYFGKSQGSGRKKSKKVFRAASKGNRPTRSNSPRADKKSARKFNHLESLDARARQHRCICTFIQ